MFGFASAAPMILNGWSQNGGVCCAIVILESIMSFQTKRICPDADHADNCNNECAIVCAEEKNERIVREIWEDCRLQTDFSRKNIRKNGVKLRECDSILLYLNKNQFASHISGGDPLGTYEEDAAAGDEPDDGDVVDRSNFATIHSDVTKLVRSVKNRCAMQQMVGNIISIVDIFCFAEVDLFSVGKFGPTKSMQSVISKYDGGMGWNALLPAKVIFLLYCV